MNLNISLNPEQTRALESLAAEYNTQAKTSLTTEEYASQVILGVVNARVYARFDASVKELADASAKLSYETRMALIAQVQNSIAAAS